jgi:RNA polymerase sigma factor for flagellar operon FliA
MIEQNLPLVRKLASTLKQRLPAHIEFDDLVQSGVLGLLDAAKKYQPVQGVIFEIYARQRIRGAMLDELRSNDWVPRKVRDDSKKIDKAIADLGRRFGRKPEEKEIADELGVSMEAYGQMLLDTNMGSLVSLDDIGNDTADLSIVGHHDSPLHEMLEGGESVLVSNAINALPEKEKQLLALYYQEEMTLKEIGAVFGVGESRICQLHSQALSRLRVSLNAA